MPLEPDPPPRYGIALDAAIALTQAGLRVYATVESAHPSVQLCDSEPASIELAVAVATPGATVTYDLRPDGYGGVYGTWAADDGRLHLHGTCSADLARQHGAVEPAPHDVIAAAVAK